MALKKFTDDTIITVDTGDNRMYFNISDELRLRSSDAYNVVLERYRDIESKDAPARKDWMFEGYYQHASQLKAHAAEYTRAFKAYGRKLHRPVLAQHMIDKYFDVWQHVNTSGVSVSEMSSFIVAAKEHELALKQESGKKIAEKLAAHTKTKKKEAQ